MRTPICILLALSYCYVSTAQDNIEDLEHKKEFENLKSNRVKKRTGWLFSTLQGEENDSLLGKVEDFDAVGHLTKRISYRTPDVRLEESFKFTSKGLMIEYSSELFPGDGKPDLTRYMYDSNGNQTGQVIYNKDGSLSIKRSTEYDENGYPINKSIYHAGSGHTETQVFENKYKKDRPKEFVYKDKSGRETKTLFHYEDDRLILKEVISDGKSSNYSTKYEYNEAGQLIKEQVVKVEKPLTVTTYEYDKQGNRTLRKQEDVPSKNFTIWRFEYYPSNQLVKTLTTWENVKSEEDKGQRLVWHYEFY